MSNLPNNSENRKPISWELIRKEGRIGTGNWDAFPKEKLDLIFEAATEWKEKLGGINKPWLCWCINNEWNIIQQRLVKAVGWTPVVGTDGRVPNPTLIDDAVFVDFNEKLKFPVMWMHFPLEFQFLFSEKLAFWHSDVLSPVSIMKKIVDEFNSINDGQYIGIRDQPGVRAYFKCLLRGEPHFKRWFEVIGCTTAMASRSQYKSGCGWWRHIESHPNAKEHIARMNPFWEHGVGIWFWEKYFNGEALELSVNIEPYHYSTNNPNYITKKDKNKKTLSSKANELKASFDLKKIVENLGL